ncbi:MAG: PAS domain S-box protein [Actinobacteria bacterium]|nr:MAG: PAS domain S-box protein [Actinomycetota bacterium]
METLSRVPATPCDTTTAELGSHASPVSRVASPKSRLLLAVAIGLLLEAAATVPFGQTATAALLVPAALAILVAALAALVAGLWAGVFVALSGWILFFVLVAERALRAALVLPIWVALAVAVGLGGDRWRRAERARSRADSQLDAVRADLSRALLELDLESRIVGWTDAAEAIYGYEGEEIEGRELAALAGDDAEASNVARRWLERVERGERIHCSHVVHQRKDGADVSVSLTLAPIRDDDRVVGACVLISDVSEQARAREELRRAEAKYRTLAENLPLVTWLSAPGDRSSLLYVSPQVETMLGYSPAEWQAEPDLFSRLLHPDDREHVLATLERVQADAVPLRCEYRLVARDGRIVWIREKTCTVKDAAGRPFYTQTLLRDISERKRADEERERLRGAERATAAVIVVRQRRLDLLRDAGEILGATIDVQPSVQRVAELTVHDLADWCTVDAVAEGGELTRVAVACGEPQHAEPGREPDSAVRAVVQSGQHLVIPPLRHGQDLDGELVEAELPGEAVSVICVPIRSRGRPLGALTFARTAPGPAYGADELALAEDLAVRIGMAIDRARLHVEVEERADAARVLAYVAEAVLLLDRTGNVRLWNPAAEKITGIVADEVVGHSAADVIPGWREAADSVPVSASPGPGHREVMIPIETEKGERWISISGVQFFGGTVYAFRDVTEVRQLEELKADFIATASHELRTPLAAVYGAAQTLLRHDFALDEAGRDRFVSLIAEESDRLGRIVNEILLANQLDAGRVDLGSEPFDPVELVARAVEAARTHAPPRISLERLVPERVPLVAADRDKVRQVLVNLIENAIKYSPDGGRIEVGLESGQSSGEETVLFYVKDQGIGIPAEEQARIFEKFYRLDPQMTRGVGGTGLGLYICSELVSRMGGNIWVESIEGDGSTFMLELPVDSTSFPRAVPGSAQTRGSAPS